MIETEWGQSVGYNNYAPQMSCSYPYNGRALAGCVATAMAQIMNYHEYPGSFNWSAMPDNYGNGSVSLLMEDIGNEVNMDYSCELSTADVDDITPAFHDYGYSANKIGYENTSHYDDVVDELNAGRPVLFSGFEKENIIGIFPTNGEGHAWVGDGYREEKFCPSGSIYLSFHMNWGWDGSYNGWYSFNDFNPSDSHYNRNSEVIINIQPE